MLTVHHLNQSRSQRVLWALEELQLPYQIVRYQREKSMLAPAALTNIITQRLMHYGTEHPLQIPFRVS